MLCNFCQSSKSTFIQVDLLTGLPQNEVNPGLKHRFYCTDNIKDGFILKCSSKPGQFEVRHEQHQDPQTEMATFNLVIIHCIIYTCFSYCEMLKWFTNATLVFMTLAVILIHFDFFPVCHAVFSFYLSVLPLPSPGNWERFQLLLGLQLTILFMVS